MSAQTAFSTNRIISEHNIDVVIEIEVVGPRDLVFSMTANIHTVQKVIDVRSCGVGAALVCPNYQNFQRVENVLFLKFRFSFTHSQY